MIVESLDALWSVAALEATQGDLRAIPVGVLVRDRAVLAGVGAHHAKYVLFPIANGEPVEEDTLSAGVQLQERTLVVDGSLQKFAQLGCVMPWLDDAFSDIATECVTRVAAQTGERPDRIVHVVLDEWRQLLAKQSSAGLSDESVTGLLAELDTLAEFGAVNPVGALSAWVGPAGGLHDFRRGGTALEVKASRRRHGHRVTINGIDQLHAPPDCELFLRFVRMERVPEGPITLERLAANLADAGITAAMLDTKIGELGIYTAGLSRYNDFAVDIVERLTYRVDSGFPRLVPESFVGGHLPSNVLSVTYEVELPAGPPAEIGQDELVRIREDLVS